MLKKPQNVYLPIDRFQAKVFKHRDSQKRGEWVENFALALAGESKDDFAESLLSEAQYNLYKDVVRQWRFKAKQALFKELGNREPTESQIIQRCIEDYGEEFIEAFELVGKKDKRKRNQSKNPQDAPHGNAGVDRKSSTSCDQFTADGDTREDSQAKHDGSAITRNETQSLDSLEPSANNCGPRQAKNGDAATREGAEDCHHHSNVTIAHPTTVSKNVSTPAISTNGRRTGGPSLIQTSIPPVRQAEPDVLSLAYSGEFGNVRLTQEQYAELGIKFGNQQKLNRAIDSLSCQIENGEKNPRNHYAELVKWANYRDDMDEKKEMEDANRPPRYETVSEHNARIVRESDKWIDEYYAQKRKAANGK